MSAKAAVALPDTPTLHGLQMWWLIARAAAPARGYRLPIPLEPEPTAVRRLEVINGTGRRRKRCGDPTFC
jgi:hypothetical protein